MWSRLVMAQVKHNSYFLCGVALGLWLSLALIPLEEEAACAAAAGAAPTDADEFSPQREERPLGPAGQAAGRSVQRPRYYTTELGMRGSLLTGVLSSAAELEARAGALNRTLARLQPALKFFITASAVSAVPGLANVVGFTDTREMLKPFHALKYLADNYLEEFDFFFLVTDAAFVNARRLAELAARLSVSQDVYMGEPAPDDPHYCSLDAGILLSNSVLRAVHAELDWCVRNSYSAHHHENLGRCVLHAAHQPCQPRLQGEAYRSEALDAADDAGALRPALADAVTARPASPRLVHTLHAYVSRVRLQRARAAARVLRRELWGLARRHPPHARNATWPAGLRADPGLAPPAPDSRFEHLRWTLFNESHAFMPDEERACAPLAPPAAAAVRLVLREAFAWARRRWAWARGVALAEGAWQWAPPAALRYRLLLRLDTGAGGALRLAEAARALGAARLVPVRYVTESARVHVVLPLPLAPGPLRDALALLARYKPLATQKDANVELYIVTFSGAETNGTEAAALAAELRAAAAALGAPVQVLEGGAWAAGACEGGGEGAAGAAGRAAVRELGGRLPADALTLLLPPRLEFNQDFLNRVRMNTISGVQWFLPLPFAKHASHAHPRMRAARSRTGRFDARARRVAAFYRADLLQAEAAWTGAADAGAAAVLAARGAAGLRALAAPEPGCVLPPRAPPPAACRAPLHDLGDRNTLAQLLLHAQHDADADAAH